MFKRLFINFIYIEILNFKFDILVILALFINIKYY